MKTFGPLVLNGSFSRLEIDLGHISLHFITKWGWFHIARNGR